MGMKSTARIGARKVLACALTVAAMNQITISNAIADPWADAVRDYSTGTGASVGYTADPTVALGAPERVTGEVTPFGPFVGDVTMFNTPFGTNEIISIGAGGYLELQFDEPIVDDPSHLYGVDLIVFGNAFFLDDFTIDGATIEGIAAEPALVELSQNGIDWFSVSMPADALFPTQGYLDAEPFGQDINGLPSGTIETDFLKPVDPSLSMSDFLGLDYAAALGLYAGSGGGAPIDISTTGLTSASYVRISLPGDATYNAEIDAVAAVPEPSAIGLLCLGIGCLAGKRRWRTARH